MTRIALIVLDTLRKDTFDQHFDWLSGRHFENAYSTANWTIPAHASLFCGKYPSELGTHAKNMPLDCEEPTLAEQLQTAGYSTRAFSANTNITGYFDFDRGFDEFIAPNHLHQLSDDTVFDVLEYFRETNKNGIEKYVYLLYDILSSEASTVSSLLTLFDMVRTDRNSVQFGGTIEAQREVSSFQFEDNEFLFLNLMEMHEPYRVPSEYRTVPEPAMTDSVGDLYFGDGAIDAAHTRQAYEDCARYLSDIYQDLFTELRDSFDFIITVADHGELLGEDGNWGHAYGVAQPLIQVPLVISGDGLSGTYEETVSILDVHSTIQDLADVDGESHGQSLLGDIESGEYVTEYLGLTSWSEQNLRQHEFSDKIEAYDQNRRGIAVADGSYGYWTRDEFTVIGDSEQSVMQDQLDRLIDDLDIRSVQIDTDVPEEIKDQLEHLGYA